MGRVGKECLPQKKGWDFWFRKDMPSSAWVRALADGQASLTDQCCHPVAVLSMSKPGIPSLGLRE